MNQRIKKLRKALDLTQQEFADKIGMKRNTVANYETDRNEPSNSVISLICREFNVSETWLRTGEGEMFVQRTRTDELSLFVNQLLQSEPDDIRRRFVMAISRLSTRQLEVLEGAALRLADDLNAADQAAPPPVPDIAAELAELKRQNQALAAKVAAMEEEDAIETGLSPSVSAGSFSPGQKAEK